MSAPERNVGAGGDPPGEGMARADQGNTASSQEWAQRLADNIVDGLPPAYPDGSGEPVGDPELLRVLMEISAIREEAWTFPPAASLPHQHLNRWGPLEIQEKIGEGSFAEVYRAYDPLLDRDVALKLLKSGATKEPVKPGAAVLAATAYRRNIPEGRMLAQVRHPNIVAVFGADQHEGRIGIWMELLEGETLAETLTIRGRLAVREVLGIGRDLCGALAALHNARIIHRDLKAQNVMRTHDGRIVVMDLGLGRDDRWDDHMTVGTAVYMPPECLDGEPATAQADLYAAAILLFHLLTGRFPYTAASLLELKQAQWEGRRNYLRDLRPELPPALVDAIERALAPRPGDRFATAGELEAALIQSEPGRGQAGAGHAAPDPPFPEQSDPHAAAGFAYDRYLKARGYLREFHDRENIEKAIQLFREALETDPGSPHALAGLGEAYWRLYEDTKDSRWAREAEATALAAIRGVRDLPIAHVTLGVILRGTGRAEAACEQYQKALAIDPDNDHAWSGLASSQENLGRFDEAEISYRHAVASRPNYWGAHNELGVFLSRRERLDEALEAFTRAAELAPGNARVLSNLGGMLQCLGRHDEAVASYRESIRRHPTAQAHSNLGHLYRHLGRYEEAAAEFERAVALNPNDFRIWKNLAEACRLLPGAESQTRQAIERAAERARGAIRINPNDAFLCALLAQCEAELGHEDEARRLVEKALSLPGNSPEVLAYVAGTLERLGERTRALEAASSAVRAGFSLAGVRDDPALHELARDPRFETMVTEVRLPHGGERIEGGGD